MLLPQVNLTNSFSFSILGLYWGYNSLIGKEVQKMPKVNVYLPDKLADAARYYQIPVSNICQDALEKEIISKLPINLFTQAARTVVHLAAKEAEQLKHDYIGTEHLLLGLIAQNYGIAAQLINELKISDTIRTRILETMKTDGYQRGSNRVIDEHGNFIGYIITDEDGNISIVDESRKLPLKVKKEDTNLQSDS